ncbi:MAG: iron-sulfur cluster assembly accessory protein [Fimbriimonadales bacterium]|nr:iron-sulfur cluster assembly accessory protein [Fimbriimonadales bacterium]
MVEFPVSLTEKAIERVRKLIEKDGGGKFLRLGVKGGGCSGLEYVLRLDEAQRDGDLRAEFDGVQVAIDPKSAEFLKGATLDFTGELIGGGFKFENPNAARGCGCGTSFTPKEVA